MAFPILARSLQLIRFRGSKIAVMAEEEIAKHTKKIYSIWNNPEYSIWHKVKDFLIEILIIVFAVTLSIWFHNWSDHRQQKNEAKQFLTGLKTDLENDIREMTNDKIFYENQQKAFQFITRLKMNEVLNRDSLQYYSPWIFNTASLNSHNARFEGFKSSGKIGTIENARLQNEIMDLYTESIPYLLINTGNYIGRKELLMQYIYKNRIKLSDSTSNLNIILSKDEAQNICNTLSLTTEVITRYDTCINKASRIIEHINEEYP